MVARGGPERSDPHPDTITATPDNPETRPATESRPVQTLPQARGGLSIAGRAYPPPGGMAGSRGDRICHKQPVRGLDLTHHRHLAGYRYGPVGHAAVGS